MKTGIFGAGFSGKSIGAKLTQAGADVWGTTRSAKNFQLLEKAGVRPVLFNGEVLDETVLRELRDTTHLVVSVAPPRNENLEQPDLLVDPILLALSRIASSEKDAKAPTLLEVAPKLRWIGYLSTVGVYGNHDGAWIDESVAVAPVSARARQRVRAETQWLAEAKSSNIAIGIFRLSGIYGPDRNALLSAEKGKARRLIKPGQVFNRIHVGDIATALTLASANKASGFFNITDDEPAPPQDVVEYAHELMGKTAPPEMDFDTAELTPMARSFYGENKRVSNAKSKSELGLEYQWPNYREALARMWQENSWKS